MNYRWLHIIWISTVLNLNGCYPGPPKPQPVPGIFYAESGNFGENVLTDRETVIRKLDITKTYSLHINIVGAEYAVRVIMPQTNAFAWSCAEEPPPYGWNSMIRINNTMLFMAKGEGLYECQLRYSGSAVSGSGEIKIYENTSATPTRTVTVQW